MDKDSKIPPINKAITLYHHFADIISKIMMGICMVILGVMVFSVSYGVLGRYTPLKNPRWTQELSILCMVWVCFLSAGYAIKNGLHVRITLTKYVFPEKVCRNLYKAAYIVLIIVNLLWSVYGVEVVRLTMRARMPATGWPMYLTYLSVVIGGIYGVLMAIDKLTKEDW